MEEDAPTTEGRDRTVEQTVPESEVDTNSQVEATDRTSHEHEVTRGKVAGDEEGGEVETGGEQESVEAEEGKSEAQYGTDEGESESESDSDEEKEESGAGSGETSQWSSSREEKMKRLRELHKRRVSSSHYPLHSAANSVWVMWHEDMDIMALGVGGVAQILIAYIL